MAGRIWLAAVLVAGAVGVGATQAQAIIGGCQLRGTATFAPGLKSFTSTSGTMAIHGDLTVCEFAPAVNATGTLSSGEPIVIGSVTYKPDYENTITGSCANNSASGKAVITWDDGTTTVYSFSWMWGMGGAGVQGSVIPSVTYTGLAHDDEGNQYYVTKTFVTTAHADAMGGGLWGFPAMNAYECQTSSLRTAPIWGGLGFSG